jgi:hypothetical protein
MLRNPFLRSTVGIAAIFFGLAGCGKSDMTGTYGGIAYMDMIDFPTELLASVQEASGVGGEGKIEVPITLNFAANRIVHYVVLGTEVQQSEYQVRDQTVTFSLGNDPVTLALDSDNCLSGFPNVERLCPLQP